MAWWARWGTGVGVRNAGTRLELRDLFPWGKGAGEKKLETEDLKREEGQFRAGSGSAQGGWSANLGVTQPHMANERWVRRTKSHCL